MGQETIEEAAKRYAEHQLIGITDKSSKFECVNDFIEGAKWQAERMYDLIDLYVDDVLGGCNLTAKEWFNQFKKQNNEQKSSN